jgi:hypothetical protein
MVVIRELRIRLPFSAAELATGHLYAISRYRRDPPAQKHPMTVELKAAATYPVVGEEKGAAAAGTTGLFTFKAYHLKGFLPVWLQKILPPDKLIVSGLLSARDSLTHFSGLKRGALLAWGAVGIASVG